MLLRLFPMPNAYYSDNTEQRQEHRRQRVLALQRAEERRHPGRRQEHREQRVQRMQSADERRHLGGRYIYAYCNKSFYHHIYITYTLQFLSVFVRRPGGAASTKAYGLAKHPMRKVSRRWLLKGTVLPRGSVSLHGWSRV